MKTVFAVLVALFALSNLAHAQGTFVSDPKAQQISNSLRQPTSTFAQTAGVVVPDPLKWLQRTTDGVTRINLTSKIETLAYLILLVGIVYSVYQGWYHGDARMILGAFIRGCLCGLCIMYTFNHAVVQGASVPGSKSFSFSSLMFTAWGQAYGWTVDRFGPTVDSVVSESTDALVEMLGEAVLVAGTVAVGGAAGKVATQGVSRMLAMVRSGAGLRDVMAMDGAGALKAFFGDAVPGAAAGLRNSITAMMGQVRMVYAATMPILAAYSAVVYISGLVMLVGLYLMPIAWALVAWGQRDSIWSIFGTFLTSLFSVIFLPIMLVVGLQIAFIQPSQMVRTYSQQLAAARQASEAAAVAASAQVQADYARLLAQCEANLSVDPVAGMQSSECQQTKGKPAVAVAGDFVSNALNGLWSTIKGFFDDIAASVLRVLIAFVGISVGMVIATSLMFRMPGWFAKNLKGTADRLVVR